MNVLKKLFKRWEMFVLAFLVSPFGLPALGGCAVKPAYVPGADGINSD